VAVGKGAPNLVGRKVTFYGPGAWAEYVLVEMTGVIPLPAEVSFEDGCNSFANPVTVVAFVNLAKAEGHRNIVHTAAASALGKMLIAEAKTHGIGVIGVVRKEEQAKEVTEAGAKACIVMNEEEINACVQHSMHEAQHDEKAEDAAPASLRRLQEALKEHKVTLGFDAVAGLLTGVLLKAMPQKSTLYVYGGLSNQPCGFIRPTDLIFGQKQVRGFWAIAHVKSKRPQDQLILARQILSHVGKGQPLHTAIKAQYSISQGIEAIAAYLADMSGGKVCIAPGKDRAAAAPAAAPAAAAAEPKKEDPKSEEKKAESS
jgi:NADPH:quinone reductase-like Zn-dependent oxidoreductase